MTRICILKALSRPGPLILSINNQRSAAGIIQSSMTFWFEEPRPWTQDQSEMALTWKDRRHCSNVGFIRITSIWGLVLFTLDLPGNRGDDVQAQELASIIPTWAQKTRWKSATISTKTSVSRSCTYRLRTVVCLSSMHFISIDSSDSNCPSINFLGHVHPGLSGGWYRCIKLSSSGWGIL